MMNFKSCWELYLPLPGLKRPIYCKIFKLNLGFAGWLVRKKPQLDKKTQVQTQVKEVSLLL